MPKGLYERTPEHNAAMSEIKKNSKATKAAADRMRGVPLSPEHCTAIKEGMENSEAVKAYADTRRGVPRTPEACAAMSDAKLGVPKTPEQIAAIKKGQEEAGVYEAMRGGNDLVTHHYIYEESDLSLNTVQMTRSDHTSLHNLLRKLGYIVPHINLPDEQGKGVHDEVLWRS